MYEMHLYQHTPELFSIISTQDPKVPHLFASAVSSGAMYGVIHAPTVTRALASVVCIVPDTVASYLRSDAERDVKRWVLVLTPESARKYGDFFTEDASDTCAVGGIEHRMYAHPQEALDAFRRATENERRVSGDMSLLMRILSICATGETTDKDGKSPSAAGARAVLVKALGLKVASWDSSVRSRGSKGGYGGTPYGEASKRFSAEVYRATDETDEQLRARRQAAFEEKKAYVKSLVDPLAEYIKANRPTWIVQVFTDNLTIGFRHIGYIGEHEAKAVRVRQYLGVERSGVRNVQRTLTAEQAQAILAIWRETEDAAKTDEVDA